MVGRAYGSAPGGTYTAMTVIGKDQQGFLDFWFEQVAPHLDLGKG